jgi:DNA-binding NarL/FixJ family response regulator
MKATRVLLVEDHKVVRSSLRLLLESFGAQVVGETGSGENAVTLALSLRPDIILMDITLAGLNGIEATRQIREAWPEARLLALTMHSEDVYLVQFLEAGGSGYVRKASADRDVIQAIESVLAGGTFLGEEGVRTLLQRQQSQPEAPIPGPELLSERELEVLVLTVRGYTSREIAGQLFISPHTVDTYRARVMDKLGLEHRHQLVEYALQHHILE